MTYMTNKISLLKYSSNVYRFNANIPIIKPGLIMNAVNDMYFMPRIICNRFFVICSNSYDIYDKMYYTYTTLIKSPFNISEILNNR